MMRLMTIAYFLLFYGFLNTATMTKLFDNSEELPSPTLNYIKDNVDTNLNTLQLIKKAGYPAEAHVVITEDGYLLTIHRIPGGKNSSSVFLQHGLLSSSADWVIIGKKKALAFLLADQGYDVWLGNFRGNVYSKAHISVSPMDSGFWDFSFDEMGMYDLPAMISYVTNLTLKPLNTYIGYSMGTTSFYIMAIKQPEIAKMVELMISLAPVAFIGNTISPMRFLAPFTNSVEAISHFLGADQFNPQASVLQYLAKLACKVDLFQKEICGNIIFLINGFDEEQFNYTLLPVILSHFPSSTSTKTILHYGQEMKSGKFCAYDYGRKKNVQIYGTTVPPNYDLSRITTPIALFHADNDWFVNEKLELIKKAGYPAEAHVVLTEDGYFLTMHRIPGGKDSLPVFLQHCLLCSSVVWVILGKEKALAYMLADQGYDVWMGNFRGNTYSKTHNSLSPLDSKFWDFSFDEMGMYDLPAMISYVTNMTLKPLHTYIGVSMGTTTFYIMAIKRPEIAKMVKLMISLAPVAFLGNTTSVFRTVANFEDIFKAFTCFLGVDELMVHESVLHYLATWACNVNPLQKKFCRNLIYDIVGFDKKQFNHTLLPVIVGHLPASILTKTILHYSQEVKSSRFCAFDYGREKNMQIYNATIPPDYDVSHITVPIALVHGGNDGFAVEKDLKILRESLTNLVDDYRVPVPTFGHGDFLWAKDAPTLVYERALKIMKENVN